MKAAYLETGHKLDKQDIQLREMKGNDPRFCYYLLKSMDLAL